MNEQKIKLEGLQVGMYVCKTDQRWSDLPFAMEGLLVENNAQIDTLKNHCQYVYIDSSRGRAASPMYWLNFSEEFQEPIRIIDQGKNEFELLRKESYQESSSLGDELEVAKDVFRTINENISETFEELRLNKKISLDRMQDSMVNTVNSVVRNPTAFKLVMELKQDQDYTYSHALRTSVWCAQFGRHLGFSFQDINELALGGMLLDVGKTQINKELLNKKECLSSSELAVFYSHVDTGLHLLAGSPDVSHSVLQMVATHHERADSSGYPQRLCNEDIPIFGRIGGIVDSYDAMTSVRPFRGQPFSPHEAIASLYKLRNTAFHHDLVEQFIQTVGVYPAGSLIELSTGEVGMVTAINHQVRLRPRIMIILDKDKKMLQDYYPLDLTEETDRGIRRALNHSAYGIKVNETFLEHICEFFG